MSLELNNDVLKGLVAYKMAAVLHEALYIPNGGEYLLTSGKCLSIVSQKLALDKVQERIIWLALEWGNDLEDLFSQVFLTDEIIAKHNLELKTCVIDSVALVACKYKTEQELRIAIAHEVVDLICDDAFIQLELKDSNHTMPYYIGEVTDKTSSIFDRHSCLYDEINHCKEGSRVMVGNTDIQYAADFVEEYRGYVILSTGGVVAAKAVEK